jgi:ribonuclease PH
MALTQNISMPAGKRADLRADDQLRPISYIWNIAPQAHGSILLQSGNTQVICAAMVEDKVPRWMMEQNVPGGWITAEYSMLPYSTQERKLRDVSRGKLDGRSQEIQRLIGRSLRAAVDLKKLGQRTIWLDCDVLSADGGTRTTSITGSFLAIKMAVERLLQQKTLKESPILHAVAATSAGVYQGKPILDLCYSEDKDAEVDMNFVMTDNHQIVEIQASAEESTFSQEQFSQMIELGKKGITELFQLQRTAWETRPK